MKSFILSPLAIGALLLAGCGGSEGQVETIPVSGTVTISGGPLAGASVIFAGQEEQPVALGRTDAQGHYVLTTYEDADGAAPGAYAVIITKNVSSGGGASTSGNGSMPDYHSAPSGGHSAQAMRAATNNAGGLVPSKYQSAETTPLKKTVKPGGENVFDFKL